MRDPWEKPVGLDDLCRFYRPADGAHLRKVVHMEAPEIVYEKPNPAVNQLLRRLNALNFRIQQLEASTERAVDEKVSILLKLKRKGLRNIGDLRSYKVTTGQTALKGGD